ncbi:MAG: potassium transporter Kef [Polyangiales bacterium]
MDEMTLLLGLLVLSYLGNAMFAPGQSAPLGLPSGAHFMVLGFLLGPHALGIVPSGAAASFMPLAMLATSWLALTLGVSCGYAGERTLTVGAFGFGIGAALLTAAMIGGPVFVAARWFAHLPLREASLVALGIGLAGCETTRQSVRWVLDRGAVPSRLLRLLEALAGTDELVPLLGLAIFFAMLPAPASLVGVSQTGWVALTLVLGVTLGMTTSVLLAGFGVVQDAWGVLLGAALLATGITWRLTLSPLTASFIMGACLSIGSRHAAELRVLLARTAPGVLLPALLLTGALVRLPLSPGPLWITGSAFVARLLVRLALGQVLARVVGAPADKRLPFGLALCSTGSVSVLVALSFALGMPGPAGDLVLTAAAASGVAGDLLATFGLRQAFLGQAPAPELVVSPS